MPLTRITKAKARRLFEDGLPFRIVGCKLRPGPPFSMDLLIDPARWVDERRAHHPDWDYLTLVRNAWLRMIHDWAHYNASAEGGTYPHYYVDTVPEKLKPLPTGMRAMDSVCPAALNAMPELRTGGPAHA